MVETGVARAAKIRIESLSYSYAGKPSLEDVNLEIPEKAITIFFGPAGGGKTTLMRLINRLNDLLTGTSLSGRILVDGENIYALDVEVARLRRRVGMVFALPLPLPGTVRENVVYGPRLAGERDKEKLDGIVEKSLTQAALWDEVKDRLDQPAMSLSGGQQQRLCIARSLALEPEILLLDEPTSGLDPISTAKVEKSLLELKKQYTIVLVPHSVGQAARMSDFSAFFLMGRLIEAGEGSRLFTTPKEKQTEDYVTGRFG